MVPRWVFLLQVYKATEAVKGHFIENRLFLHSGYPAIKKLGVTRRTLQERGIWKRCTGWK
jgi:hypothetical protein